MNEEWALQRLVGALCVLHAARDSTLAVRAWRVGQLYDFEADNLRIVVAASGDRQRDGGGGFGFSLWGFFVRHPAAAELGQGAGNVFVLRDFAPRRECRDSGRIAGPRTCLVDHPGGHYLLPDFAVGASSAHNKDAKVK